jgi:enoyl-CoA hydratase/carnithine racemase
VAATRIRLDVEEAIARITVDGPERRNALDRQMPEWLWPVSSPGVGT